MITENEEKSCADTIFLISSIFKRFSLKGNKIEVSQSITDDEVEVLFQANHRLDRELTDNQRNEDFDKCLKLKEFLDHSTKQHHYFYSIKKCGNLKYKTCLPPHLPLQTFQKLHHLPDPMLISAMKAITKVFGKVTTVEHRPSKKVSQKIFVQNSI